MHILLVAAAFAVMSLGAAQAQTSEGASLTLMTAGPSALIQDGAQWRCEGAACKAARVKGIPALHACKRIVGELGPVSAFTWRGKALDQAGIAACNGSVKG